MPDYDAFADAFDAHAAASAYNAHYDRPAMLDLIGDVSGQHVLDAGCGPGLYARELLDRGAAVQGVDGSPRLIELARSRCPDEAAGFRVHDLDGPLPWPDASFDLVVLALVLHHLSDPGSTLAEFRRVLRPHGRVVLSTVHPVSDWLRLGGSYFTDERLRERWNAGWEVEYRRQPLGALTADFADAGFVISRLVEPRPASSMRDAYPDVYERLLAEPAFLMFELRPWPGPPADTGAPGEEGR